MRTNLSIPAAICALALGAGLAACGGDDNSSDTTAAGGSSSASSNTVSTKSVGGVGNVLVDSNGAALYTNNMDNGPTIACNGSCAAIWVPVAGPSSGQPTASDASVQAKLGTVDRPDGATQVTFDGKPLYTFTQDSPGKVTGDGLTDSFGGTTFTWTAAAVGGAASGASGATTTTAPADGGSGGGYGGY